MGDLLTYRATDFLMFAPETYYRLFALYNHAVWPMQIVTMLAGAVAFACLLRGRQLGGGFVLAALAAAWIWIAWAYFQDRYTTINWAAKYFAIAFIVHAIVMSFAGPSRRNRLVYATGPRRGVGLALFLFALVPQPLIGPLLLGRPWDEIQLFGLAPDPTVVATLGALLVLVRGWFLAVLLVLPLAWGWIAFFTLWSMDSPEAWVMLAAGAFAMLGTVLRVQETE